MLGVALRNEYLTLVLGISGSLVFLLVVTSRRDELTSLRGDLHDRMKRKRQERQAAKLAWEAVQRIELCMTAQAAYEIVDQTAQELGCDYVQFTCEGDDASLPASFRNPFVESGGGAGVSGPSAIFRLSSGQGRWLTVSLGLPVDSSPAADIVFRYLQRLSLTLAERLDWLQPRSAGNEIETVASPLRSRRAQRLVPAPEARG
jgi:UDP-GlcNAc:undecaprenyl-phosphate GlcNAc-1-phosphate transferase